MTTTPRTLTLRLPLPLAELNPNARLHWAAKARAVRVYRQLVRWGAQAHTSLYRWQPLASACLSVRFCYCGRRRALDADNALASFKAGVDALVDAGVLTSDAAKRVSYGSIASEHCKRGCKCGGYVELVIEAAS